MSALDDLVAELKGFNDDKSTEPPLLGANERKCLEKMISAAASSAFEQLEKEMNKKCAVESVKVAEKNYKSLKDQYQEYAPYFSEYISGDDLDKFILIGQNAYSSNKLFYNRDSEEVSFIYAQSFKASVADLLYKKTTEEFAAVDGALFSDECESAVIPDFNSFIAQHDDSERGIWCHINIDHYDEICLWLSSGYVKSVLVDAGILACHEEYRCIVSIGGFTLHDESELASGKIIALDKENGTDADIIRDGVVIAHGKICSADTGNGEMYGIKITGAGDDAEQQQQQQQQQEQEQADDPSWETEPAEEPVQKTGAAPENESSFELPEYAASSSGADGQVSDADFVYSKDASCSYKSLDEAIDAAAEGSTIAVAPGVYSESFTLNKKVTVRGAAAPYGKTAGAVAVFAVPDGQSVRITDAATVKNIVFTSEESSLLKCGTITIGEYEKSAADTPAEKMLSDEEEEKIGYARNPSEQGFGSLVCITADAHLASVYVAESPAHGIAVNEGSPEFSAVHVIRSAWNNFNVRGGGSVRFSECVSLASVHGRGFDTGGTVSVSAEKCFSKRNRRHGFIATDTAAVNAVKCQFVENSMIGTGAWKQSSLTVADSEISGNGGNGIYLQSSAPCRFTGSSCASNRNNGISVLEKAQCTVESCRIEENSFHGCAASDSASVEIKNSAFDGNGCSGLGVWNNSTGIVEGTELKANGRSGLCVCDNAVVNVKNAEITANAETGIEVFRRGVCNADAVTVKFGGTGICCTDASKGEFTGCTVNSCGEAGIIVKGTCEFSFADCVITGTGIQTLGKSKADFEKCTVTLKNDMALYVAEQSQSEFSGCTFNQEEGNEIETVRIADSASPKFDDCETVGSQAGIGFWGNAGGEYTGCSFLDVNLQSLEPCDTKPQLNNCHIDYLLGDENLARFHKCDINDSSLT